jgi:hypothetical protein
MEQLTMIRQSCLSFLFALPVLVGCKQSDSFDQAFQENHLAYQIAQALQLGDRLSGTNLSLTNLLILTNYVTLDYLAGYERKLLRYGKDAGFTNSLLEKYAAVPQSSTVVDPSYGQLVLIGASVFKQRDGQLGRWCVTKTGSNYGGGWIPEDRVQSAFRSANAELPRPSPAPSLRSLSDPYGQQAALERQMDVWEAEDQRLNPPPFWRRRAWQAAGVVVVLCALLYGFFRLARRP